MSHCFESSSSVQARKRRSLNVVTLYSLRVEKVLDKLAGTTYRCSDALLHLQFGCHACFPLTKTRPQFPGPAPTMVPNAPSSSTHAFRCGACRDRARAGRSSFWKGHDSGKNRSRYLYESLGITNVDHEPSGHAAATQQRRRHVFGAQCHAGPCAR